MDISQFDCSSPLPYPQVVAGYPDMRQVQVLLNDYAGRESEVTAILQYTYQHFIFECDNELISEVLARISVVEMHHMALLGEAITTLGGDPIIGGTKAFWNGSYINYIKNPQKALLNNIKAEEGAIENYKRTIALSNNATVKALIERIILDEEIHIKIFKELLKNLPEHQVLDR